MGFLNTAKFSGKIRYYPMSMFTFPLCSSDKADNSFALQSRIPTTPIRSPTTSSGNVRSSIHCSGTTANIVLEAVSNVNGAPVPGSGGAFIIDTGTTLIVSPVAQARAFWAAVPGSAPYEDGYYTFPCNSPPAVSLSFSGAVFPHAIAAEGKPFCSRYFHSRDSSFVLQISISVISTILTVDVRIRSVRPRDAFADASRQVLVRSSE